MALTTRWAPFNFGPFAVVKFAVDKTVAVFCYSWIVRDEKFCRMKTSTRLDKMFGEFYRPKFNRTTFGATLQLLVSRQLLVKDLFLKNMMILANFKGCYDSLLILLRRTPRGL